MYLKPFVLILCLFASVNISLGFESNPLPLSTAKQQDLSVLPSEFCAINSLQFAETCQNDSFDLQVIVDYQTAGATNIQLTLQYPGGSVTENAIGNPHVFNIRLLANGFQEMYSVDMFTDSGCATNFSDFYTSPNCENACEVADYHVQNSSCQGQSFDFELDLILEHFSPNPETSYNLTVLLDGGLQGSFSDSFLVAPPFDALIPMVDGDGTTVNVDVILEERGGCQNAFSFVYEKPSCTTACTIDSFALSNPLVCNSEGTNYDAEFYIETNALPDSDYSLNLILYNQNDTLANENHSSPPANYTMFIPDLPADGNPVTAELIMDGTSCSIGDTLTFNYTPPTCSNVTFAVSDTCAAFNGEIVIPITTRNFTNINGFQYSMYLDPAFATIMRVDDFGLPNWDANDFTINSSTGEITLTYLGNASAGETLTDNTVLFNIYANTVADAGATTTIEFRNEPTAQEIIQDLVQVEGLYQNGTACILEQINISGNIQTPFGTNIGAVAIVASGNNTNATDNLANGNYSISIANPVGETTLTPSKIDNSTTGVSIQDALFIKEHALERQPLANPYLMIAADVDGSGSVTIVDVVRVKQMIRGEITMFPVGQMWVFIPADYQFTGSGHPTNYPTSKTYTDLSTNLTNEDYIGVKYGDVTGDAVSN